MITMGFDSKHKDWVLVLSYLEYVCADDTAAKRRRMLVTREKVTRAKEWERQYFHSKVNGLNPGVSVVISHQQQFFSELHTPRRSHYTNTSIVTLPR